MRVSSGMSHTQAKHLAMLCVGGYALFIGTRALLEEKVPVPSRRHALLLETGATAFIALPEKWKPFCPAINLHESVLDRIWLQQSLSPARLRPAGTTLEVMSAPPHRPECVGPAVRLRKRQTVRLGAWVAWDFYLTAGSEWGYTVASSAPMAVLQMTGDGYAAWQKGHDHKGRWGVTATDLYSVQRKQDRPAGILGAHLVQDGNTELHKWRVEAEGRYFLVIVPVGEGGGRVSLDLDINRTAHCHTPASRGDTDRGGRWLEMPGSAVGFIVRVPQRETQETRPVKEFFRCRAVDETVDF